MTKTTWPAKGEHAAIVGYGAQYATAAGLIYDALLDDFLETVTLVDPNAGRVDDIQIATPGAIHAFQVKWHEFPGSATFNDFIKQEDGSKPPMIQQLADGWRTLTDRHPDKDVHIHFVTNSVPSTDTRSFPSSATAREKWHFARFLAQFWEAKEWRNGASGEDAPVEAWRALQLASKLPEDRFPTFCEHLRFRFAHSSREDWNISGDPVATRRRSDIQDLAASLFRLVSEATRLPVHLTRADLLAYLGWTRRFSFRFKHEFPVDHLLYEPIAGASAALERAISQCTSGYVCVLGSPGSGKSTLLTQTLRYRKGFKFIRYYAFVPGDPTLGRGESESFLHDLSLALDRAGQTAARASKAARANTRAELLEVLRTQLLLASEDYARSGIKTIIAIDGLDHIDREQHPARSLIADLPSPDIIPSGVVFVLGTQTLLLNSLSPSIRSELDSDDRKIDMSRLERDAVRRLSERAIHSDLLDADLHKRIFEVSQGHPLSLRYTLAALSTASDVTTVRNIADTLDMFGGDIEGIYKSHWTRFPTDQYSRNLYAFLARFRLLVNIDTLEQLGFGAALDNVFPAARHFFDVRKDGQFRFFHNSFRLFLQRETAKDALGAVSSKREAQCHGEVVKLLQSLPPHHPWRDEIVAHAHASGDDQLVLQQCDLQTLRRQWQSGRPFIRCREDVGYLLRSSQRLDDGIGVLRGALWDRELDERSEHFHESGYLTILGHIDGWGAVLSRIVADRDLQVADDFAMQVAASLDREGQRRSAEELFDLAEPLDALSGAIGLNFERGSGYEMLASWAAVAWRFRSFDTILDAFQNVVLFDHGADDLSEEPPRMRSLVRRLIKSVVENGDVNSQERLKSALSRRSIWNEAQVDLNVSILDKALLSSADPSQIPTEVIHHLLTTARTTLDDDIRLNLTVLLLRAKVDRHELLEIFSKCVEPTVSLDIGSYYEMKDLSPFRPLIHWHVVRSALTPPPSELQAIGTPPDDRQKGQTIFLNALIRISQVLGRGRGKHYLVGDQVVRDLMPSILIFHKTWRETRDWNSWHAFQQAQSEYFSLIIRAASSHGSSSIQSIDTFFGEAICSKDYQSYWPTNTRRDIAKTLFEYTADKDAFSARLARIDSESGASDDPDERSQDLVSQAMAWIDAGRPAAARAVGDRLHDASFGIWHRKDGQIAWWAHWLNLAVTTDDQRTIARIAKFAGVISLLNARRIGSGRDEATQSLVSACYRIRKNAPAAMREWMLDVGGIRYDNSLTILLSATMADPDVSSELTSIVLRHIALPFQSRWDGAYADCALPALFRNCSDIETMSRAAATARAARLYALPTIGVTWVRTIATYLNNKGLDGAAIARSLQIDDDPPIEPSDKHTLTTRSGEKLSTEMILSRCNSDEELANALDGIEDGYPDWKLIAEKVQSPSAGNSVEGFKSAVKRLRRGATFLTLLGNSLAQRGNLISAEEYYRAAIDIADRSGWNAQWDGGSKLEPWLRLIAIKPSARVDAFQALVDEYLAGSVGSETIVRQLDVLSPVLFGGAPDYERIFGEIESHINELHEFRSAEPMPVELLADARSYSGNQSLAALLFRELARPIPEIRGHAIQAISELIDLGAYQNDVRQKIQGLLKGSDSECIDGLWILECLNERTSTLVDEFQAELSDLCNALSVMIRYRAGKLLGDSSGFASSARFERRDLPATYRIVLPPFAFSEARSTPLPEDSGASLPTTDDPVELVRSVLSELELINRITGIPTQNLVVRTRRLMHEIAPPSEWDRHAEDRLRAWCIDAGLETAFRRPRTHVAVLALHRAIAELVDADHIDDQGVAILMPKVEGPDVRMALSTPELMPSYVEQPIMTDMGTYPRPEWVSSPEEAIDSLRSETDDGQVILGETAEFLRLEWKRPTELRFSMVCSPGWNIDRDQSSEVPLIDWQINWTPSTYPEWQSAYHYQSLVLQVRTFALDILPGHCLVFNPAIGNTLGWSLDDNGLFRWVDPDGATMVETVWWRRGPLSRHPPQFDELCAEGSLLIASPTAWARILEFFPDVVRAKRVERRISDNGEIQALVASARNGVVNSSPVHL